MMYSLEVRHNERLSKRKDLIVIIDHLDGCKRFSTIWVVENHETMFIIRDCLDAKSTNITWRPSLQQEHVARIQTRKPRHFAYTFQFHCRDPLAEVRRPSRATLYAPDADGSKPNDSERRFVRNQ